MTASYHVMIDIETLGQRPTAIPWQIGIVVFKCGDPDQRGFRKYRFDMNVDEGLSLGLTCDASTLAWFTTQSESVRNEFSLAQRAGFTTGDGLRKALGALEDIQNEFRPAAWWAHRAHFDYPILRNAFWTVCKRELPFDFRLIADSSQFLDDEERKELSNRKQATQRAHNALADAEQQAMAVAMKQLKLFRSITCTN